MHRDPEARATPFTVEEFIPGYEMPADFRETQDAADGDRAFQKARLMVALMGGVDNTKGVNIQIIERR